MGDLYYTGATEGTFTNRILDRPRLSCRRCQCKLVCVLSYGPMQGPAKGSGITSWALAIQPQAHPLQDPPGPLYMHCKGSMGRRSKRLGRPLSTKQPRSSALISELGQVGFLSQPARMFGHHRVCGRHCLPQELVGVTTVSNFFTWMFCMSQFASTDATEAQW